MNFYGEKKIVLNDADVHLHYANNKGRGADNVTVTIVPIGTPRHDYTREYDLGDVYDQYRTSGWKGKVNIYNFTIKKFGGLKS